MINQLLFRIYENIEISTTNLAKGRYWILKTTLLIVLLTLFFAFPSYESFDKGDTWTAVLKKADDLTYNLLTDYSPGSNASKINFRLTMPFIAGIFRLGMYDIYILQVLSGIVIIYLLLRILHDLTRDKATSIFIALTIASTYAGRAAFVELRGLFDAVSIMFILLAIRYQHPLAISACVFAASWNDERGIISSIFLLLFYVVESRHSNRAWLRSLLTDSRCLAVYSGWIAFFSTRLLYSWYYNIPNNLEGTGPGVLLDQINMIPMGLWTAFEGGWLLLLLSWLVLALNRQYFFLALFLTSLAIIMVGSLSVVDVSRSTAYALPALIIAVGILADLRNPNELRLYSFLACLLAVSWPAYYAGGVKSIWWQYPLPIQILRWIIL